MIRYQGLRPQTLRSNIVVRIVLSSGSSYDDKVSESASSDDEVSESASSDDEVKCRRQDRPVVRIVL